MFYPVRVFNQKGKLKKEITPKNLSKSYWDKFNNTTRKNIQISSAKGRVARQLKGLPDLDESYFSED